MVNKNRHIIRETDTKGKIEGRGPTPSTKNTVLVAQNLNQNMVFMYIFMDCKASFGTLAPPPALFEVSVYKYLLHCLPYQKMQAVPP
jgi:hypothetical protein